MVAFMASTSWSTPLSPRTFPVTSRIVRRACDFEASLTFPPAKSMASTLFAISSGHSCDERERLGLPLIGLRPDALQHEGERVALPAHDVAGEVLIGRLAAGGHGAGAVVDDERLRVLTAGRAVRMVTVVRLAPLAIGLHYHFFAFAWFFSIVALMASTS